MKRLCCLDLGDIDLRVSIHSKNTKVSVVLLDVSIIVCGTVRGHQREQAIGEERTESELFYIYIFMSASKHFIIYSLDMLSYLLGRYAR